MEKYKKSNQLQNTPAFELHSKATETKMVISMMAMAMATSRAIVPVTSKAMRKVASLALMSLPSQVTEKVTMLLLILQSFQRKKKKKKFD